MDEFALIEKLFGPLAGPGALDLKDDAAILTPPPGMDLVLTKDAIVEGVHFRADDPAQRIAQKLQRVNLSDLAAKGAKPLGYLLAAAFRADTDPDWLDGFAAGLAEDQATFGWSLLGGDTVATPGPLTFSLTAIGTVATGKMILRTGAVAGDDVFVTGTIGDAGLGLALLADPARLPDAALRQALIERYQVPQPRVCFGARLHGFAHAAVDVSDGLLADAGHLAKASGVALDLELAAMPVSDGARAMIDAGHTQPAELAGFGDDYELVFTCAPSSRAEAERFGAEEGVRVSRIGTVRAGDGVHLLSGDGSEIDMKSTGYTHF